jgi:cytochrome c oxidase subunit II
MIAQGHSRRVWIQRALAVGAAPLLASVSRSAPAQGGEAQVVKIVAQRFRYTPGEFRVKAGQPIVLEFTSLDFVHGFNMPDLKVRADLPPGRVTRLALPAAPPGTYDFVCDNFCGDKHEEMHGRMIVET